MKRGESAASVRPHPASTGGVVVVGGQTDGRSELLIRCPDCSAVLGATLADVVVARHKRRVFIGVMLAIRCECGWVWKPAHVALAIAQLEELTR